MIVSPPLKDISNERQLLKTGIRSKERREMELHLLDGSLLHCWWCCDFRHIVVTGTSDSHG